MSDQDRFNRYRENNSSWDIWEIGPTRLVLEGGGDFYEQDNAPINTETCDRAYQIAMELGMLITSQESNWWEFSEYLPEPGSVSIFNWRALDAAT